jgi:hypothetical protein
MLLYIHILSSTDMGLYRGYHKPITNVLGRPLTTYSETSQIHTLYKHLPKRCAHLLS